MGGAGAGLVDPVRPGTGWPGDQADQTTLVASSATEVRCFAATARGLTGPEGLDARVSVCRACPRLVAWRETVAVEKRRSYEDEPYWGRPIAGWGSLEPRVLIIGLAPAAHGGNRTGRVFTGDRSGDWLFGSLHRVGLAALPTSTRADDGQQLLRTRMVAAVRCAPPGNKPLPVERDTCAPWLEHELTMVAPTVRAVVALGGFAWAASLRALAAVGYVLPDAMPAFGHAAETVVESPGGAAVSLLASYHPSQQNTFTGRLTEQMLDAVLGRAAAVAAEVPRTEARGMPDPEMTGPEMTGPESPLSTTRVNRNVGLGMGILGALIVTVVGIAAGSGSPLKSAPRPRLSAPSQLPSTDPQGVVHPVPVPPSTLLDELLQLFILLCVVALAITIIVMVLRLFFGRHSGLIRRRVLEPDELNLLLAPLTEGYGVPRPTAVEIALAQSRAALLDGADARAGIIAAWLRLQELAVDAGTQHRETDTPTDLVARLLAEQHVGPSPLERLANLYRRARFSPEDLVERDRVEAVQTLDDIRRELTQGGGPLAEAPRRLAPAPGATGGGRWT